MTFANMGWLGVKPGRRDELMAILLRPGRMEGCLLYEVGTHEDSPDTVFVMELWDSREAHAASLQLPAVREAMREAMPLLSDDLGGQSFDVVGSPLRP